MSDDERLGIGGNAPPEPLSDDWTDERLLALDPEKLLVLPADLLPRLFELQFPGVGSRFNDLYAAAEAWQRDHVRPDGGLVQIADDQENNALTAFMQQLRDFAGDDGEVDTARKACKLALFNAIKKLDAWWNERRDPIMAIHGVGKTPHPTTMQFAQTAFLKAKLEAARAEQERIRRAAEDEARRREDEAKKAWEQEAARAKALEAQGVDAEAAAQMAAQITERAAEEADIAAAEAVGVAAFAETARAADLVRSRSSTGTTTLATEWDFAVTSIKELCRAVADGEAPETFVMVDERAVRQAIRRKQNPVRKCAGLEITETYSASRRRA